MKLQRAGFTEGNLLFTEYMKSKGLLTNDDELLELRRLNIQDTYSKNGFYDKSIRGAYFDIDVDQVEKSENFKKLLKLYKESILGCDYLEVMTHIKHSKFPELKKYNESFKEFMDTMGNKNASNPQLHDYWKSHTNIYPYLKDKKVLVLNSFGSLIHGQYVSGKVHKIFPNFPILASLDYIDFPYTFFNDGPHQDSFETLDYYFEIIKKKNFDIALISCGPLGCILVDKIVKIMNKDAFTMGSGITPMFGIEPGICEPYWVSKIPDKYIPVGFEKIENGRYWIGKANN